MRRFLLNSLAVLMIALVGVAGGCAQSLRTPDQQPEAPGPTFSVRSQLVEIHCTVTEGKKRVPHLKISDFEILEDGKPVAIDRLDSPDVPIEIALLVDVSESVADSLHTIQDAASAFLESLHPQDRVLLVLFNSEIRSLPQTTDDRTPLLGEIRNARARGLTKLYEALLLGMRHLDGKSGRKAIVCFTDGENTAGSVSRMTALTAAARAGHPIYAIGAGAGLGLSTLQMILRDFAEINGGRAFFIESPRRLREAFAEVSSELRSAYVLNYYTRVPADGRWHDLDVRPKNPAHTVHARKGFFARSQGEPPPSPE
jgi:VWFA-related protein